MTDIRPLKPPVSEHVVEVLEDMLAQAQAGKIVGFVALISGPGFNEHRAAGEIELRDVYHAYENWKFDALLAKAKRDGLIP